MKRIRSRTRLDILRNQERAAPARWSRRIYLGLVGALAVVLANYLAGDFVFLRADGIVIADRHAVSATYPARVAAVLVKEGDRVRAGDVLLRLESAEMLKDLAELAARDSDLSIREGQLRTRVRTVAELLPLAERHSRESADQVAKVDLASARGLVSTARIDQALQSGYETSARLAELRGQSTSLAGELQLVEVSRRRSLAALQQLEGFYDQGQVRASAYGIIGARVPVPGQVVRFGDEMLQLHQERRVVLAYLPDGYLFRVEKGDRVAVTGGATQVEGVLDAVLGVSDALPAEFQNMFRPRDRSRLVRVEIPTGADLAVSQKVRVSRCWRCLLP